MRISSVLYNTDNREANKQKKKQNLNRIRAYAKKREISANLFKFRGCFFAIKYISSSQFIMF